MRPLPPQSRLISAIHDACMAPPTTPTWHHLRRLHARPRRHRPVPHFWVSQYPAPQHSPMRGTPHSPMREAPSAHARHSPMRTPALAHATTSTLMRVTPLAHAQHPPMRTPGLAHAVVSTLAHANRLGANPITTRPREHHDVSILAAREHHPHSLCMTICAHNERVRYHHSHTTEHFTCHSSPIRATTGSRISPTRTLAFIQARFKLLIIGLRHETSDSSPTRTSYLPRDFRSFIVHPRHDWPTIILHHSTPICATTGSQTSPTRTLTFIQTRFKLLVIRSRHGWRTTISHETLNRSSFNHATTGPQSSSITQTVSHETSHSSPSSPTRPPITHNHLPRDLK